MPSLLFPSTGAQVLSFLVHFLGVSVLSHCISRRTAAENLTSWRGLMQLTWPRLCILLVFVDSWLFLFSSGVLVFGVGLEIDHTVCSAAIDLCIVFYATSKILIYAFLIERVHIVWSPAAGIKRFKSPVYIICFVTVCLYAIVIATLLAGRVYFFRPEDSACVIGLRPIASIPLLAYDLYINVFLTSLFLSPLLRSTTLNPRALRMARRALIAAGVALTTSTANIAVLTSLHGKELGWVCLASCGADVIFNALALFWVTGRRFRSASCINTSRINTAQDSPSLSVALSVSASRLGRSSAGKVLTSPLSTIPRSSPYETSRQDIPSHPPYTHPTTADAHEYYRDNPFARPTFIPKYPEPVVTISANHDKPQTPSALKALANLFRKDTQENERELQVTVTTRREYDIEDHGSIGRADSHCSDIESRVAHSI